MEKACQPKSKIIMRKIILLAVVVFLTTISQAQNSSTNSSSYKNALGVKVLDGGGITFKHFVSGNNALEFIGYFWNRGTRITGYMKFMDLSAEPPD